MTLLRYHDFHFLLLPDESLKHSRIKIAHVIIPFISINILGIGRRELLTRIPIQQRFKTLPVFTSSCISLMPLLLGSQARASIIHYPSPLPTYQLPDWH